MEEFHQRSQTENQIRAVRKALERTRALLDQDVEAITYDSIHSVKSILYAAIEQVGLRADRLLSAQRMLRELFAIVITKADLREYEKKVGMQILNEIYERYGMDLIERKLPQKID